MAIFFMVPLIFPIVEILVLFNPSRVVILTSSIIPSK